MKAITREEKIMSGENLTPITRKELFLAKAAGFDVETPEPITREEMFLSQIQGGGGGVVTPKQQKTVDITENGTVVVTPDYGYTLSKVTANVNVVCAIETPVQSSFDNTGDGIAEVYSFSKALPTRFTSGYAIEIDAVKDITDDNGIHQESSINNHYSRYDEIATDTGTMPYAHVYCKDNSNQYLHYSFKVSEEGIYELCTHLRIKDAQLRGATYAINKGEAYEHAFVTTHGFGSEDEAFEIRNNDHLQGSYMSGMTVYLRKGINTIRITNAEGVTKNQHFRNLYLVKKTDISIEYKYLTMDEAEKMGVGLAEGAKIFSPYYITVTFNNGAPRDTDGFCRVRTSNGNLMSIHSINTNGAEMPLEGDTVTLVGKIGCVNSAVNGSIGKEARIFDATLM